MQRIFLAPTYSLLGEITENICPFLCYEMPSSLSLFLLSFGIVLFHAFNLIFRALALTEFALGSTKFNLRGSAGSIEICKG